MANNYVFIVCKACRKSARIASYYPSNGWDTSRFGNVSERLDAFFDKHDREHAEEIAGRSVEPDGELYEFCYESNYPGNMIDLDEEFGGPGDVTVTLGTGGQPLIESSQVGTPGHSRSEGLKPC